MHSVLAHCLFHSKLSITGKQQTSDQQSSKYYQRPRTCFSKSNFWSISIPRVHLPCMTVCFVSHRLSLTSGKKISTASELLSHTESVYAFSLTANEITSVSCCMAFIFTQTLSSWGIMASLTPAACAALNRNDFNSIYTWLFTYSWENADLGK